MYIYIIDTPTIHNSYVVCRFHDIDVYAMNIYLCIYVLYKYIMNTPALHVSMIYFYAIYRYHDKHMYATSIYVYIYIHI